MRVTVHWALPVVHADKEVEGARVPGVIYGVSARNFYRDENKDSTALGPWCSTCGRSGRGRGGVKGALWVERGWRRHRVMVPTDRQSPMYSDAHLPLLSCHRPEGVTRPLIPTHQDAQMRWIQTMPRATPTPSGTISTRTEFQEQRNRTDEHLQRPAKNNCVSF